MRCDVLYANQSEQEMSSLIFNEVTNQRMKANDDKSTKFCSHERHTCNHDSKNLLYCSQLCPEEFQGGVNQDKNANGCSRRDPNKKIKGVNCSIRSVRFAFNSICLVQFSSFDLISSLFGLLRSKLLIVFAAQSLEFSAVNRA